MMMQLMDVPPKGSWSPNKVSEFYAHCATHVQEHVAIATISLINISSSERILSIFNIEKLSLAVSNLEYWRGSIKLATQNFRAFQRDSAADAQGH